MSDITWIILSVLVVFGGLVFVFYKYVVPYLKSKMTTEEWIQFSEKLETITTWIITGVRAAEWVFKAIDKSGTQKNSYVLDFVRSMCEKYGITFDEEAVKVEIEKVGQDLELWGATKDEVEPE